MPTPSPKPEPKGPYKYKQTNLKNGITAITPMTTAELNAEKAKAPGGTSVWRDPSVGYDGTINPLNIKEPKIPAPGIIVIKPNRKNEV
jgi:hypothetical protein